MNNITAGIIGGLGHIGLIQAACLAELGYVTIAYDKDQNKFKKIHEKILPFQEPGLEELITKNMAKKRLSFTTNPESLSQAELIYICVNTSPLASGETNLSQVFSALNEIMELSPKKTTVAIKSTVPVGTAAILTKILAENNLAEDIKIVSNPEFLSEGSGVTDFWHPTRVVVGSDSRKAAEFVASIYSPPQVPVIITSSENAELIKYASNAFLATKISFINEIARFCERAGADIRVVSKGIGLDPRIGTDFLEAGAGFSGPCLEKDLKSLIFQAEMYHEKPILLKSVLDINEQQRKNIVKKLENSLGRLERKKIAVWGMAFKPETDDVRSSHSLPILKHLLSMGALVTVHDPWVRSPEQTGIAENELPEISWSASPYGAAENKDAILILTAWSDYRKLDFSKIKNIMSNPLIVDGRNMFDPEKMQSLGIKYLGVGI